MSVSVGKVVVLEGVFQAKGLDGSTRQISKGDTIYEGEIVIGSQSNNPSDNIVVSMKDGSDIVVLGQEKQLFDASLSVEEFAKEETVTNKDSILAMLEANGDIENIDDLETAAGEVATAESTEGGEAAFAQANNASTDISADLRDRIFEDQPFKSSAEILITEAPTTEAPVTEAPVTEAPVTEAPAAEAPITEAPATEAPTTEAPATEAPATEAPTTEAPATEAPVTEAPAEEDKNGNGEQVGSGPGNDGGEGSTPNDGQLGNGNAPTEAPTTEAPATEAPAIEAAEGNSNNNENNGHGNGDQDAPGGSLDSNNAENDAGSDSEDNGNGHQNQNGESNNGNDGGEGSTPDDGVFGNGNALLISEEIEIDFGQLSQNNSGVNSINLGEGNQSVTNITLGDVLDITGDDNILRIDGNSGDSIELNANGKNSEWTLCDSVVIDSETDQSYNQYTGHDRGGADVTLEVSTNIQVDES